MPSAANAKSEKPASSEATDNSPVRQIMTIIEHKIRNLEKRKSKLTSYRDLQKAGKDLNSDQKVAVAKYDEVAQTLEFARDLAKQVASVATSAEREAKKQAKKDAWVRYAAETSKIREVLLILDCLVQMGNSEARDDFLNGANGACKLTEEDLKILDDLYPEVTPKHELNEEGQPGFHVHTTKAAEHLYAIIDGKPKEILGTTYTHIKEIVSSVHECGYFDKGAEPEVVVAEEPAAPVVEEGQAPVEAAPAPAEEPEPELEREVAAVFVGGPYPPLRAMPPITLQEVEHAYFAHQYPQGRLADVIGSQNFYFLQESEIDSPAPTPTPQPPLPPAGPIPTQTFTNQHFVLGAGPVIPPDPSTLPLPVPPQPHFPPPPPPHVLPYPTAPLPASPPQPPEDNKPAEEWKQPEPSPEREDTDRKTQGQGDGQRFRRYGNRGRGTSNGFRGRGSYQGRPGNDYHGGYQGRTNNKEGYQNRQYGDRHKDNYQREGRSGNDGYYGNGDADGHAGENGRERYGESHAGGFKGRGRGAPRGSGRRPPRPQYSRRPDHAE